MAIELFLVKLDYKTNSLGAGSMMLQLAVDPEHKTLNGRADGTILEGTQHAPHFTASGTGLFHSTGFGVITKIGTVKGQAVVSFSPPAIGSYLAPFSASFEVDNGWCGKGHFSVGTNTYECQVTMVN